MELNQVKATIAGWAKYYKIDEKLALAIADQESNFRTDAVRFEAAYPYLYVPDTFAGKLRISTATERALQRFSYGPMQVMGAVCRELGYDDTLAVLPSQPSVAVSFAVKHLSNLARRFPAELDLIAAYNAGSPRKVAGGYVNQEYVDKVSAGLKRLREHGTSG